MPRTTPHPPRRRRHLLGLPAVVLVGAGGFLAACDPAPPRTCHGYAVTAVGTEGDDVITGTDHADVIVALAGDDTIRTLGDNDVVCGGRGADRIDGGVGRDVLDGGAGVDRVAGGPGADRCPGERTDDVGGCEAPSTIAPASSERAAG